MGSKLDQLCKDLNKQFKTEFVSVGHKVYDSVRIPFTSPRINYMTYGGIPIGKATEIFGPENGGKTTTALDLAGQAQRLAKRMFQEEVTELETRLAELEEKNNKGDQKEIASLKIKLEELQKTGPRRVVYVDHENTLDLDWAEKLGVDVDEMILVQPQDHTAEQVLQIIIDFVETGEVILVVLDSIAMLIPQGIYQKTMEDKSYCGAAGPLADFSKRVSSKLAKFDCGLICINQVRDDMQNPFNIYKTPGGRALRHLYALRLFVRKGTLIDDVGNELKQSAECPAGNIVDVHVVKTKVFKPNRRIGSYTLKYIEGIDVVADTVDMAIRYNYIIVNSSWYTLLDPDTGEILKDANDQPLKFQGKANLCEALRDDEYMFEEMYEKVNERVLQV